KSWEESLVTARVMTGAARPHGHFGESAHWTERAEALLAPLFHAAATAGLAMRDVVRWVLTQELREPMALLGQAYPDGPVQVEVLSGIAATEERERSGIFSTTAGILAAYRSTSALDLADRVTLDPASLASQAATVYICAPARYQALVAPVVVAFLEQVRAAAYGRFSAGHRAGGPVTLLLDEVANIAPLPDLPAMVSEGGGQGLLTMACLQDLSQARSRWGHASDGFLSLFGTKVVLPGIADMATLEAVSKLAGQVDVPLRSVNYTPWWAGRASMSITRSWRRQERIPVDQAHSIPQGTALVVSGAQPPTPVALTPWWAYPPFCEAARLPQPALPPERSPQNPAQPADRAGPAGAPVPSGPVPSGPGPSGPVPSGPVPSGPVWPGSAAKEGAVPGAPPALTWHKVATKKRLHPPPPSLR
ncbi:MAG TPA: TraM recognition domain-containing protein, partial [Acidimicrobiales bacterium]|nr:TraM recognition domain-containing protein [Acidimicrobiales bacterium]